MTARDSAHPGACARRVGRGKAAQGHLRDRQDLSPPRKVPLVRLRIARRAAGMGMAGVQVQEPRPLPCPPIPPLFPGDLLAGFGPANQTAAPGANSPEECFDRALSSRRRERITSPNAGAPAACLVRDVTR